MDNQETHPGVDTEHHGARRRALWRAGLLWLALVLALQGLGWWRLVQVQRPGPAGDDAGLRIPAAVSDVEQPPRCIPPGVTEPPDEGQPGHQQRQAQHLPAQAVEGPRRGTSAWDVLA